MGETYEAKVLANASVGSGFHPSHIALKVISLRQITDWKILDLFEREANVLAHLDYPGIPRYLDSFYVDVDTANEIQANRYFYLVRELIPGESLGDLATSGWHPQEAEIKTIALQVLRILDYLHTLSPPLIHRDIKPQNLIRRPDGKIFLVDFGSVQEIYRHTFLGSNTFVGTARYMPPEQFRGQVSAASDLYGLGATLLYLATRKTPDQLPQSRMKVDLATCTHFSRSFTAWLDKLLEPMEEDRFQQAKAAAQALKQSELLLPQEEPQTSTLVPIYPSTKLFSARNRLPMITRPANARSVVERSPQSLLIKIPLPQKQELNWDLASLDPKQLAIEICILSILFLGVAGLVVAIWQIAFAAQVPVMIFLFFWIAILTLCVLRGTWSTPLEEGLTGHEDTLHLVLQDPFFELKYLMQYRCTKKIRGHTDNLHVSLQIIKRRNGYAPQFVCVLSGKSHDYKFGQHLSREEQEWLVAEITIFLKSFREENM